jgi:hypothetical protein
MGRRLLRERRVGGGVPGASGASFWFLSDFHKIFRFSFLYIYLLRETETSQLLTNHLVAGFHLAHADPCCPPFKVESTIRRGLVTRGAHAKGEWEEIGGKFLTESKLGLGSASRRDGVGFRVVDAGGVGGKVGVLIIMAERAEFCSQRSRVGG